MENIIYWSMVGFVLVSIIISLIKSLEKALALTLVERGLKSKIEALSVVIDCIALMKKEGTGNLDYLTDVIDKTIKEIKKELK